jgi:hypothetical protein
MRPGGTNHRISLTPGETELSPELAISVRMPSGSSEGLGKKENVASVTFSIEK